MFRSEYGNVCNVAYVFMGEAWFEIKATCDDFVIKSLDVDNPDIDSVIKLLKSEGNKNKYLLYSEQDVNSERYRLAY